LATPQYLFFYLQF